MNEISKDVVCSGIIQLFRENKGAGIENLKAGGCPAAYGQSARVAAPTGSGQRPHPIPR